MAIIQKRADQLQPGDILRTKGRNGRVVLSVTDGPIGIGTFTADLGAPSHHYPAPPIGYARDTLLDVVVPDARVTDDELDVLIVAATRLVRLHESGDAGRILDDAEYGYLGLIVDRLRPPPPPTMGEVLAALAKMTQYAFDDQMFGSDTAKEKAAARDLLDRARRAGLLPKEDV